MENYDFSGYATRNDLLCGDGRTIRKNAFRDNDGDTVPLVWNHRHNEPENVLGHAVLENREDGVYAYCTFNDTESGKLGRQLVQHGDIRSLSIYANKLKQVGKDVIHGCIRELSLVHAGANPGAFIDFIMEHGDEGEDAVIANYDESYQVLSHSEKSENSKKEDESMADETKKDEQSTNGKTVKEVFDEMTEEQQNVVYAMVGMALEEGADDEEDVEHNFEGDEDVMKHNVFDQENPTTQSNTLSHADQAEILALAAQPGVASLQKAIQIYAENNSDSLAHAFADGADGVEALFPEHELITPGAPKLLRDMEQNWVANVISKIKKTPYSRIRTRFADARVSKLTEDLKHTYKAKGYNDREIEKKITGVIKLLGRKTEPTTIYLKDKMHRDDIIDIQDFDVVQYIWNFMRENFNETLALAALVGDGREDGTEDKISEENIRPIWKDDELYTIHALIDFAKAKAEIQGSDTSKHFSDNYIYAEAMIMTSLYTREKFKGTGTPDLLCTPHFVNQMLLARDYNGRRIYDSKADLARALNVNSIIEIEQLEGLTREAEDGTRKLVGLIVNLADYQFGSAKGGELTKFSDFDIDYNKYTYLMESRLSGALTMPNSAIALEELVEAEAAG
jgi:hypothetical protein